MALTRMWRGNGVSTGTLTTSTAGRGDDPFNAVNGTTDVTVVASGTQAPRIKLVEPGAARNARWDVTPQPAWSVEFEHECDTLPTVASLAMLQVLDSVPTQIIRLHLGTTGTVTLFNTANASIQASSSGLMSAGVKYLVRVYGDNTGTATAKVYLASGGSALVTLTGATGSTTDAARFVFGSVAAATCTGRYYDRIAVYDVNGEPVSPSTTGTASRVSSNAGGFTATGGTLTAVVADVSDATYAESPVAPPGSVVTYQLEPLSTTDVVTATVRSAASAASPGISQTIALLGPDGTTVLATRTDTLTTTQTDRSVTSSTNVTAGEMCYVRVTETGL